MESLIEVMLKHRSIRKFKSKAISQEHLEMILSAAQAASTSSFLQAYSIINITNNENRETLMHLCGDQSYVSTAPVFLVFCADLHRLHLMTDLHEKPYERGWTETLILGTVDAALAGQNAMVAAEALGLGGVYIGGIRNNIEAVSKLLGLPEEVYPVFGLCLGHPDQDPEVKERLPRAIVVHQDKYTRLDHHATLLGEYDERIREYYTNRTKGKVKTSWSESVAEKLSSETRPGVGPFLKQQQLGTK